jgi:hypothetical protein
VTVAGTVRQALVNALLRTRDGFEATAEAHLLDVITTLPSDDVLTDRAVDACLALRNGDRRNANRHISDAIASVDERGVDTSGFATASDVARTDGGDRL